MCLSITYIENDEDLPVSLLRTPSELASNIGNSSDLWPLILLQRQQSIESHLESC